MATTPAAHALCRLTPRSPGGASRSARRSRPASSTRRVLITDALCYSAADIFAAGFQDNGLGGVLGATEHTGAGAANVWTHELLRPWLPDLLGDLPGGADFRVALRRATRTGASVGVPLEDLGVRADRVHRLTQRDITEPNQDLLASAVALLENDVHEADA